MADRKISELPFGDLTPDSIIPIISNNITSQTTFGVLLSKIPTSSGNGIDTFTTGGTYNEITGVATFTNNTGGTYSVTGFNTTIDTFTTGGTYDNGTAVFTNNTGGTYSITGFSIGNEYWSGGTGLNSVVQINSNNQANGINSFVIGSGNSANSQYSVAMGINSIADGFEILPIKTQKTVISGITMTSSDPNNETYAVVFSGVNVYAEWEEYLWNSDYSDDNLFNIFDSSGNTYTIDGSNLWDIYYDISSDSTYIVDGNIPLTSYLTISGAPNIDIMTAFERPAFVIGSNSLATGANSIVLGSNITGTSDNTTYVDYFKINRFVDDNVIFGTDAGASAINAFRSNFIGQNAGNNSANAYTSNFIGYFAGYNATGASSSNFIGANAGFGTTSAAQSNFLGQSAGGGATNAYGSNFLGSSAGYGATGAWESNFLGQYSGFQARSASNSNFFGRDSGYQATGTSYSNFFGPFAGSYATGAQYSNFFGTQAGYRATNANRSNFFGYDAGLYAIGAIGSNFFGAAAGAGATGASYSNLFGFNVGNNSIYNYGSNSGSIGSNNIIIGTNISLLSGTTNSINIGGVLFGKNTYSATTGYSSTIAQTTGRIGINVVNPLETLDVNGPIRISSNSYTGLTSGATTPVPSGGEGTIVYDPVNQNFFGWTGNIKGWKPLSL